MTGEYGSCDICGAVIKVTIDEHVIVDNFDRHAKWHAQQAADIASAIGAAQNRWNIFR